MIASLIFNHLPFCSEQLQVLTNHHSAFCHSLPQEAQVAHGFRRLDRQDRLSLREHVPGQNMVGMRMADDQGIDAHQTVYGCEAFSTDARIDQYGPVAEQQKAVAMGKSPVIGSRDEPEPVA